MKQRRPVPCSDALVFFGATGDLAYKKIFPALQAMAKRGQLDFPVIGVGRSGWIARAARRARARRASTEYGGLDEARFDALAKRLRLRRRRLQRPGDVRAAARAVRARARSAPRALPGDPAEHVPECGRRTCTSPGCAADARVIVEKPFGRDLESARALNRTLHERLPGREHLPHRSLPRQGGGAEHPVLPLRQRVPRADLEPATTSRTCRSRWPRRSASRGAASSTRRPASSAT